jgi:hypothetical protein
MQRWTRVSPRVPLIFYRARRALIHRHSDDDGPDAMEKMSLLWARILAPSLPVGVRGWEQLAGCHRASAVVANGGRRRGFGVALSPMRGGRKTKTDFPVSAIKRSGTLCWALAWLVAGRAGGLCGWAPVRWPLFLFFSSVKFFSIFCFCFHVNSNLLLCFAGIGFGNFYPTIQGIYLAPLLVL